MDSGAVVALTGLLTIQGVQMFSSHAPKISEVRRAGPGDTDVRGDLRVAELEAVSVMVLAGVAVSSMSGSSAPMWLAISTSVLMVGIYEWTLAKPAKSSPLNGDVA